MSSFKPIDGSKEDFRKYLDRKGVLDAITKVLIKCNSDRPENAIEYLLINLGEKLKDKDTISRLDNELNDARNEIESLKRELSTLRVSTSTGTEAFSVISPSGDECPVPNEPTLAVEPEGVAGTETAALNAAASAADTSSKEPINSSNTEVEPETKAAEATVSEPREAGSQ